MRIAWNVAARVAVVACLGLTALPAGAQGRISADDFARDPQMRAPALSPDGTKLVYILTASGQAPVVMFYDTATNKTSGLLPATKDSFSVTSCLFKTDSRILCSFRGTTTDRRSQFPMAVTRMVAMNADGSEQMMILQSRAGFGGSQFTDTMLNLLPDEPDHILVQDDHNSNFFPTVFRLDVHKGKTTPAEAERQPIMSWMADRAGEPRFGSGFRDNKSIYSVRPAGEKYWHTLDKVKGFDAPMQPLGFGVAPNSLIVSAPNAGRAAVWELDISEKNDLQLLFSHAEVDVNTPLRSPFDNRIVGFTYETDRPKRFLFDDKAISLQATVDQALAGTWNEIVGVSRDNKKAIVRASSDTQPATYYFADVGAGKMRRLGQEHPQLDKAKLASMTSVQIPGAEGAKIPGYLTLPVGVEQKNLPAVVLPHGNLFARDRWGYDSVVQMLANRGYAVLQVNFRGSSGYGEKWQAAGAQGWTTTINDDITTGTRWLASQGIADPKRICIVSSNYGAFAAFAGVAKEPSLYRCVASIAGMTSVPAPQFGFGGFGGGSPGAAGAAGGASKEMSANAPVKIAEKIKIPTLLIHGTEDTQARVDNSKNMEEEITKAKGQVELVLVEGADHEFTREDWRRVMYNKLDGFLAKHLGAGT
jgi:dienelactone hydrolase